MCINGVRNCCNCPSKLLCLTYKNTVKILEILDNGSITCKCDLSPVLEVVTQCCELIDNKLNLIIDLLEQDIEIKNWKPYNSYKVGYLVKFGNEIYKCIQDNISQPSQTPPTRPDLWELEETEVVTSIAVPSKDITIIDTNGNAVKKGIVQKIKEAIE